MEPASRAPGGPAARMDAPDGAAARSVAVASTARRDLARSGGDGTVHRRHVAARAGPATPRRGRPIGERDRRRHGAAAETPSRTGEGTVPRMVTDIDVVRAVYESMAAADLDRLLDLV